MVSLSPMERDSPSRRISHMKHFFSTSQHFSLRVTLPVYAAMLIAGVVTAPHLGF